MNIHRSQKGKPWMYVGHRRGVHGFIRKPVRTGRTILQEFRRCIILSVVHFPYYESPNLILIKESLV
jgi:hypothetical protein